jgi:integrase
MVRRSGREVLVDRRHKPVPVICALSNVAHDDLVAIEVAAIDLDAELLTVLELEGRSLTHTRIVPGSPAAQGPGRTRPLQAPVRVSAAIRPADHLEDIMSQTRLVDVTGRRRSPAASPGHFAGCVPPNKGQRYPAHPPTVEEIILVMRQAGRGRYADRTRGLIAILRRARLRISEALALTESDLDSKKGSVLVRSGKGGKRRMVGMDDWAWEHVARWTEHRIELPIGPLFCILAGATRGRGWSPSAARGELRRLAAEAGVRSRFAPHQLRHAHAIEMAHEAIALPIIQRQLGHAHLGITSIYLQGIDTREIVDTVNHRRPPVIPASAGLRP